MSSKPGRPMGSWVSKPLSILKDAASWLMALGFSRQETITILQENLNRFVTQSEAEILYAFQGTTDVAVSHTYFYKTLAQRGYVSGVARPRGEGKTELSPDALPVLSILREILQEKGLKPADGFKVIPMCFPRPAGVSPQAQPTIEPLRPKPTAKDFITVMQASSLLGISRAGTYKLAREKKLQSYRPTPRRVLFSRTEVLDYLQRSAQIG